MPNFSLFHFDLSVLLPSAWRRRQTVLVVEDEGATVGLIERSAKAEGFEVLHADSAEQAEGALLKNGRKFALVMLDIGLPGKCGWALRRELLDQFPNLRVCMMSVPKACCAPPLENLCCSSSSLQRGLESSANSGASEYEA